MHGSEHLTVSPGVLMLSSVDSTLKGIEFTCSVTSPKLYRTGERNDNSHSGRLCTVNLYILLSCIQSLLIADTSISLVSVDPMDHTWHSMEQLMSDSLAQFN